MNPSLAVYSVHLLNWKSSVLLHFILTTQDLNSSNQIPKRTLNSSVPKQAISPYPTQPCHLQSCTCLADAPRRVGPTHPHPSPPPPCTHSLPFWAPVCCLQTGLDGREGHGGRVADVGAHLLGELLEARGAVARRSPARVVAGQVTRLPPRVSASRAVSESAPA